MKFYFVVFLTFLFQIALKGNILLASLYGLHLHASPFMLGGIIAAGSLFPMLLASFAGRLSDRLPLNLLLAIGMIGSGLSLLTIYLFNNSLIALLIIQLAFGLFQIITVVSSQNLVGVLSTEKMRTKNYASYTLSVSFANFFGPLLVGLLIDLSSYSYVYLLLGGISILPGVIFLFMRLQASFNKKVTAVEISFYELLVHPDLRVVFVTSGVILTAVGLFEFYFPIYGNTIGLSASIIGTLLSINAVAFIISRLLMNKLQRHFSPEQIIGGCLIIAGSAFFLLPFMTAIPLLAVISFIMGIGLGCCQPLSIVMAYNSAPAGHTGEVLGIRLTVNKAVQFAVPIIFGSINFLGFFPIFWMNTLLLLFSGKSLLKDNSK
ncbi:MFS transporter [Metasolibacillus sp. FSL K6-0083]|uniref:MFS transporter n=1 Tax=Metasolibacillus sp. FSL K6-0083 TaxID=2921416 RepID=UPI00315A460E